MIEHETRRRLVADCVNDDDGGDEENDLVCDGTATKWISSTSLNTTDRRDRANLLGNHYCVYHVSRWTRRHVCYSLIGDYLDWNRCDDADDGPVRAVAVLEMNVGVRARSALVERHYLV